jgi:hypothetical protein
MMLDTKPTVTMAKAACTKPNLIGSGKYRNVYRKDNSEWCFKVDRQSFLRGDNKSEWETYLMIKDAPWLNEWVRIPEMHMLDNGILAARYIEGTHPDRHIRCYPDHHRYNCIGDDCWAYKVTPAVLINDIHSENIIVTAEKVVYLIDLGHGIY